MCCIDLNGVQVRLTENRWHGHTLKRHHYLEGQEQHIKRTVEAPEIVDQDQEYPRRKCFYRKVRLPDGSDDEYLKVVVEYEVNAHEEHEGSVITAFAVRSAQDDGERLWPKDQ